MVKLIVNAMAFNACWFGLVLLGNTAVPFALAWVVIHIALQRESLQELRYIASVVAVGAASDSLLIASGVLTFEGAAFWLPLWMITLWFSFSTTLNHSLAMLRRSRLLRTLVAFTGAPSSYLLGSQLGNVELGLGLPATFAVFAVTWFILLEIFSHIPIQHAIPPETCPES
ncbi:DUF2878 domain-containing protein [Pseudohongiella nitratireducens]|uniref:DUF2878 domain-containing protein n=1 Tax=Pseudohongiella nitratireducens TaxID=1768907 RepID=UPI0030EC8E8C|tara:strand:+ start:899 stop:1411 length:513 start_codon:yes stop_codon:yes gene_type:complete